MYYETPRHFQVRLKVRCYDLILFTYSCIREIYMLFFVYKHSRSK